MWIEMFFIKFEGKSENVRGNAENIFNFTQEIFFGRITNYWTLLFEISTFFLDMRRFPEISGIRKYPVSRNIRYP